jgi:HlyD family secretion protein
VKMTESPRRRRIVTIAVILLLVSAGVAYAFRPEVIDVESALVERAPMRVTVDEDGRTRVRNRFVIAAPVAGKLQRIMLHEGDQVTPRQVVALISPLPLDSSSLRIARARLRSAEAVREEAASRVSQARVALEQSRNTERRREALAVAGAIAPAEREEAATDARIKASELAAALSLAQSASAEIAAARAALLPSDGGSAGTVPVLSPVRGRVLRIPEQSERVVAASSPILELGDAAALEVVSDVLSSDAVRLQPGSRVQIVEWGGDSALEGRVRAVEPSAFTRVSALGVDEQRVNVVVDLMNPPRSLGDGYRVEIRATVWESTDVLTVPSSALFQRSGKWAVFVADEGRARVRNVSIGHRTGASAEVTAGLNQGERVILFPSDKVVDGSRVQ